MSRISSSIPIYLLFVKGEKVVSLSYSYVHHLEEFDDDLFS